MRYYFQNSELCLRLLIIVMIFKYECKQSKLTHYLFWVIINPERRIDFGKIKMQSS